MDKKQKISWSVSFGSLALVAGMVSYLGLSNGDQANNSLALNQGQPSPISSHKIILILKRLGNQIKGLIILFAGIVPLNLIKMTKVQIIVINFLIKMINPLTIVISKINSQMVAVLRWAIMADSILQLVEPDVLLSIQLYEYDCSNFYQS